MPSASSVVLIIHLLAGRTTALSKELGYPCYAPYSETWRQSAGDAARRNILRYISFATTACTSYYIPALQDELTCSCPVLLVLAIATLIVRYKGHSGGLIQVLRRDGGLYYVALAGQCRNLRLDSLFDECNETTCIANRFGRALVDTPAIVPVRVT